MLNPPNDEIDTVTTTDDKLLSLQQVSKILGITVQRVYQMDSVLQPVFTPRGTKMKSRHYKADIVERLRTERGPIRELPRVKIVITRNDGKRKGVEVSGSQCPDFVLKEAERLIVELTAPRGQE